MATFNFTVRATDSQGSYADRAFNITVRNTKVERYALLTTSTCYTSSDGVTWTNRTGNSGTSMAYGNNTWVVMNLINTAGGIYTRTSPDGVNWVNNLLPSSGAYTPYTFTASAYPVTGMALAPGKVRFINGYFFLPAIGTVTYTTSGGGFTTATQSFVMRSIDGVNWQIFIVGAESGSTNLTGSLISIHEDNGTYFVSRTISVGDTCLGWKSTNNGVSWTTVTATGTTPSGCALLTRINGYYMAFNPTGTGFTTGPLNYSWSNDGVNWTSASFSTSLDGNTQSYISSYCTAVTDCFYANGKIYVTFYRTGSQSNGGHIILTSVDGLNWTAASCKAFTTINAAVIAPFKYSSGVFLIASNNGSGSDTTSNINIPSQGARFSTDGITYTTVLPSVAAFVDVAMM